MLVVGGGVGGTAAGIQSARTGARTLIVEPTPWLGGMLTAAGVSATDGNHLLPSGLWAEFREQLYKVYGGPNKVATGWVSNTQFEPHVGDSIFKSMAARESNLTVLYGYELVEVLKKGDRINGARFKQGTTGKELVVRSRQLIDATELGDAIALAGVPFDVGMEASSVTGEDVNVPASNDIIQDVTYAAILKDYGVGADCTIVRPPNYDPLEFDGACTDYYLDKTRLAPNVDAKKMIAYGQLPNRKYMINWPGYGNDIYLSLISLNPVQRREALEAAKQQTLRFIYFLQTQLGFRHLGLANDEFQTSDRLPYMVYHREGRRMRGLTRFKVQHLSRPFSEEASLYRTGISVGDYPIDHHHRKNPNAPQHLGFYPVPSYNVPLGSLIPPVYKGIIAAEKSISVSNVVNGTTRLQPCVLLTGQAAGLLAAKAALSHRAAIDVPVRELQQALLDAKAYIMPYADITPAHPHFASVQRIGATGLLRGRLQPSGWANRTWFDADSLVRWSDLNQGLSAYIQKTAQQDPGLFVMGKDLIWVLDQFRTGTFTAGQVSELFESAGFSSWSADRPVRRIEVAVALDRLADPFRSRAVNHQGNIISP
ncbi:MAG: FAD-dependent oxidoreductase [Bacteroidetes bacterium]|nr:FAD-dependent oxidoreductase [Bacteroidota bacterium]